MKLNDISILKNGKKCKYDEDGQIPIYGSNGVIGYTDKSNSRKNSIVIGRVGANAGSVFFSAQDHWVSDNAISVTPDTDKVNPHYLYYVLVKLNLNRLVEGSAQPLLNQSILNSFEIKIPDIQTQNKVVERINVFDKKIVLNKKINANLDELMSEIFERYVTEANVFTTDSLSNIANYKNGLAMQRFRPNGADKGLPVLKIKELNQGFTDSSSDRCSSKISNDVIVKTGDIIFSWSGTLIVKIWTGTTCGLNQHLFKVTSDKYPKWFIYKWTEYYLRQFQSIAAGKATTMGHIKRSDLKQAEVKIPHKSEIDRLDKLISPIFKRYVNNILEINSLKELKNELLSKIF